MYQHFVTYNIKFILLVSMSPTLDSIHLYGENPCLLIFDTFNKDLTEIIHAKNND